MATDKIEILIEAKIAQAIADLKKMQDQAKKNSDGFNILRSNWLKFAAVTASAAVGIKKAMDFSREFLQVQQGTQAMERQFGVSSKEIIKRLKEVSNGTISTKDIVISANRAMALNVTKDLDQMSQLLAIARERGKALGVDTSQAFNDIVTGIGRGSPLILDNLGIITKGWDEEAKAAGVAMDTQFILNKVLKDGAKLLENAGAGALTGAEKLQQFSAGIKNLQVLIGGLIVREITRLNDALKNAGGDIDGFKVLEKILKTIFIIVGITIDQFRLLSNTITIVTAPFVQAIKTISSVLNDDMTLSFKNIKKLGVDAFNGIKTSVKTDFDDMKGIVKNRVDDIKDLLFGVEEVAAQSSGNITNNNKSDYQKDVEAAKAAAERKKNIQQATLDVMKSASDNFFQAIDAQRQAALDRELTFLQEQRQEALNALNEESAENEQERLQEQLNEAERVGDEKLAGEIKRKMEEAKAEEEKRKREEEINAEFDKKEAAAKRKAAIADKAVSITQSIINTALAVTKTIATMGLPVGKPFAVAAGIMGALQTATIAAQPIPKFARGTDFAPGGPSLVGEQGPEIVNLPTGSQVIPNEIIRNIETTDNSKREFHFHGIQNLSEARNELLRTEGIGEAF